MCSKAELSRITKDVVDGTLRLLPDKVCRIILYGSYARGDFNSESDVDIMILLNCDIEEVKKYRKQCSKLSSRIGLENDIEVSMLLRDRMTYEEGKAILPFYRNVEREGVILYG